MMYMCYISVKNEYILISVRFVVGEVSHDTIVIKVLNFEPIKDHSSGWVVRKYIFILFHLFIIVWCALNPGN